MGICLSHHSTVNLVEGLGDHSDRKSKGMAKSGGKQTQNIAGTNKIRKAELYKGSAKCNKPHHFPPCMFLIKPMNIILVVQISIETTNR